MRSCDFERLEPKDLRGIPVMVDAAKLDAAIWPAPDGRYTLRFFVYLERND